VARKFDFYTVQLYSVRYSYMYVVWTAPALIRHSSIDWFIVTIYREQYLDNKRDQSGHQQAVVGQATTRLQHVAVAIRPRAK
jgi:hypothetical protein